MTERCFAHDALVLHDINGVTMELFTEYVFLFLYLVSHFILVYGVIFLFSVSFDNS